MKRLLLTSAAVVLGGHAYAADLPVKMPVKAPPAAPASVSWSGCYLGGNMGVARGHTGVTDPNSFPFAPGFGLFAPTGGTVGVNQTGGFGGGQVGCDYEFASHWVVGLAGDFSFADIDRQTADPFFAGKGGNPIQLEAKTEWLASTTGRIGYAWDRWMLYGKGGAAWTHNRYTVQNTLFWGTPGNLCVVNFFSVPCNATGTNTRSGWTAGAGLELAITDHWSAGIEYDHYDFGTSTVLLTDPTVFAGSPSSPVNVKQRIDAVQVTVDYHFSSLGP